MFPQALLQALESSPEAVAFERGPHLIRRREFLTLVAQYVGGLTALGFRPADSIALDTGVTCEAYACQVAAYILGLRVIAVKPGTSAKQLPEIAAGASHLVVDDTTISKSQLAFPTASAECAIPEVLHIKEIPAHPGPLVPRGSADSVALVVYTSGSTGEPKGLNYTYADLSASW